MLELSIKKKFWRAAKSEKAQVRQSRMMKTFPLRELDLNEGSSQGNRLENYT